MTFDPEYQLDDAAWDEGERFWRTEIEHLEAEAGQQGEWRSWEPQTWGDGVTAMPRK